MPCPDIFVEMLTKPMDGLIVEASTKGSPVTVNSEMFKNLRAGPVIRASRSNDSTVRSWIRNNGLRLSYDRSDTATRPLYDLADTARLYLMTVLTGRLKMSAGFAAEVVNAGRLLIDGLAAHELLRIDGDKKGPPADQWMMALGSLDGSFIPEFVLADIVKQRGFLLAEILVDLRAAVRIARDSLANELQISIFELPADHS